MGETRVDLLHLLEDLRDAYPGAIEETILTEIVANSLDSGAGSNTLATDPVQSALTVVDDGFGMKRRELARYHDIAATTKTRGQGIGFAGVGIKLGLLVGEAVLTETLRGRSHVATTWGLSSRHRAPWKWVPPPGLVAERGTAVRLKLRNPLSPLLDPGFVETALRRHFQPLFEPEFDEILSAHYARGVRFVLNGRALDRQREASPETAPLAVRLARKRKPSAVGYMTRERGALPEERRGIAVSTFGKVIKRGWEWLGIAPASPERVGGLIEVPALADCLTLNKADFIRVGARGATYLTYRKAIQEAVASQLAAWGDSPDTGERARRRAARPVERDLEAVLMDLAESFPLLASLVEHRAGGQRRLPVGQPGPGAGSAELPGLVVTSAEPQLPERDEGEASPSPAAEGPSPAAGGPPQPAPLPASIPADESLPTRGPRRPERYGLSIQFDERPDDPELGRLVESTVWVNEAHPAYRRAAMSRSEGYHIALAVAMALAPLAVEPAKEHGFVTAFMASWGEAIERRKRPRRR